MITKEDEILTRIDRLEHKIDAAHSDVSKLTESRELDALVTEVHELKELLRTKSPKARKGIVDTIKDASKDAIAGLINSESLLTLLSAIGDNIKDMDTDRILNITAALKEIIDVIQQKDATVIPYSPLELVRDFSDMLDVKIRNIHINVLNVLQAHRKEWMSSDKDVSNVCLTNSDLIKSALYSQKFNVLQPAMPHKNNKTYEPLTQCTPIDIVLHGSDINVDVYVNLLVMTIADLQCIRDIHYFTLLNNQLSYLSESQYTQAYHALRDWNFRKTVTYIQSEVSEELENTKILTPLDRCESVKLLRLEELSQYAQYLIMSEEAEHSSPEHKETQRKYITELSKAELIDANKRNIVTLAPELKARAEHDIRAQVTEWADTIDSTYANMLRSLTYMSFMELAPLGVNAIPECISLNIANHKKVEIIEILQDTLDKTMRDTIKTVTIVSQSSMKGIKIPEVCLHHALRHIDYVSSDYKNFMSSILTKIVLQNLKTIHEIEIKLSANANRRKIDMQQTIQSTQKQVYTVYDKISSAIVKAVSFVTTMLTSVLFTLFSAILLVLDQVLNIINTVKNSISQTAMSFNKIVTRLFNVAQVVAEAATRMVNTFLSIVLVGTEAFFATIVHVIQNHTMLSAVILGAIYASYKMVAHWLTTVYTGIGMFYVLAIFILAFGTIVILKTAIYERIHTHRSKV